MHVFAVGKKDVSTSENSMLGCILNPNMGSSVVPVTNCNTFSNVIGFLLPPLYDLEVLEKHITKKFCVLNIFQQHANDGETGPDM